MKQFQTRIRRSSSLNFDSCQQHSSPASPDRTAPISAELLLSKGYASSALSGDRPRRHTNASHTLSIASNSSRQTCLDQTSLTDAMEATKPDEVYNLAAQSFVQTSWTQPVLTGEFTALGVTRMLEALRKAAPNARFYQASSSEQFGKVVETPQRESTPFYPRSHMAWRRCTVTGSRSTTARASTCTRCPGFSSITNRRVADSSS
jgi:hypothetical protein